MKRLFRLVSRAAGLSVFAAILACLAAEPPRVLLLTGQSNHNWQATTPKLQKMLEAGGRFSVTLCDKPQELTAEALAGVAVIVSNWNAYGKPKPGGPEIIAEWPEATRAAYVDFVRNGGGHVVVHAGSSSFPDWADYHAICLATWGTGTTGHGPVHEFEVRIDDPDHPVTSGVSGFKITDELWHRPKAQPAAKVLASSFSSKDRKGTGEWEPCLLAGQFGEGRCFTILLGHMPGKEGESMDNPMFAEMLTRGVEWAAKAR